MSRTVHADNGPRRVLVGVGVGPGDPELVTLQAARLLAEADVVLVPATEASGDGPGRAEQIVTAVAPEARIERIPFSMGDRKGVTEKRRESWQASADAAITHFQAGVGVVAMATVGDPSVFSTFSYLAGTVRERLSDVEVRLAPGITAMQALAANSGTPLCEGTEVLALVPATRDLTGLGEVLEVADSVCIYKGGRQLPALRAILDEHGRSAVVGTNVSLPEQTLADLADLDAEATAPYFSAVLTTPERTSTGGAL
ncbi:MAG: precorrin-2 C(20)-methyltransferase [Luteococcus sp.]|uniref:precorrin-2 C(20)-methyltransferase n=1 Tax=Luteococcus sp. TaxID=1969402 RepID=UPI00264A27D6|nr:precorrin-2 C(20)-methyltransferase [Luteococcus sp.]MDN5563587.1 precorrin-2 C(20)-methyltransferase [Luteococcus sp.]